MFKGKKGLLTMLILIMTFFIACQSKKTEETKKESTESKENVEITLMIPDWGAPTDEMLTEFKAETGITVKVLPTAWDDT
ncbi:MAG: sugar ABC transporter substrate-binding protein, partial [Leptotrichiaceae bacterium]|nr:sugar ABC transporter substrate-binding protein [Leptotrichiaceae bacterium]